MAGRGGTPSTAQWKDVVPGQTVEVWADSAGDSRSRAGEGDGATPGKGRGKKDSKNQGGSWQPGVVKRVERIGTRLKLYVTYKGADGREISEAISQKEAARLRFSVDSDGGEDSTQTKSGRKSRKSKDDAVADSMGTGRTFEVGMRVRVLFSDGVWYTGDVHLVKSDQDQMEILFDDGDKDSWPLQDPGSDVQIIVPAEELADTIKSSLSQTMTVALTSWLRSSQLLSGNKIPKSFSDALNAVSTACAKTVRSSKGSVNTEESAAQLLTSQTRARLVEEARLLNEGQWEEFVVCLAASDSRFKDGAQSGGTGKARAGKGKSAEKEGGGKGFEAGYDLTAKGTLVEVEWDKEWYIATVVKHQGGKVQVLYAGTEDETQWVVLDPQAIRAPKDDDYVPIVGFEGEEVHCWVEREGKGRWVEATVTRVDRGNQSVLVSFDPALGLKDEKFGVASSSIRRPKPEDDEDAEDGGGAEPLDSERVEVEIEVGEHKESAVEEATPAGKKRGRGGKKEKGKSTEEPAAEEAKDKGGSTSKGRGRKSKGAGGDDGGEKGKEGGAEGGGGGREGDKARAQGEAEGGAKQVAAATQDDRGEKEGGEPAMTEWVQGVLAGAVHELDVLVPQQGGQRARWSAGTVLEANAEGLQIKVRVGSTELWLPCVADNKHAVRPAAHIWAEGAALEFKAGEGYKGEVLVLHGGCWLRGSLLGAATGKGGKKAANKDKEGVKVVVTDKQGSQQRLTLPLCRGCLRSPSAAATAPAVGDAVQVWVQGDAAGVMAWTDAVVKKVDVAGCRVEASVGGTEGVEWFGGHCVRKAGDDRVSLLREMVPSEEEGEGERDEGEGATEGDDKMEVEGEGKEAHNGEAKDGAGREAGGEGEGGDEGSKKRKREGEEEGEQRGPLETVGPIARYEQELRRLQREYNEGKEALKEDIELLLAEINACHLRFHRATIGCTVAGKYRKSGVRCTSCRARIPGKGVMDEWRVGFTQCAKCGVQHERKRHCLICNKVFLEVQDQMLQCSHCTNWVHGPCDGLDEISLAAYYQAGREGYLCPHCRRPGERGATIGELRFIPIAPGGPSYGKVEAVFGVRLAADGRVLYGLQYQGGKELEWRGGVGGDATIQSMALLFVMGCFPGGTVLHPSAADARERVKRWGELVKACGGPKSALKIGPASLQDLNCLYIESVQGVRKIPAEMCGGVEGALSTPDVYVDMVRGGLSMWGRLPVRNAALLELTAAFLFSAVGVVSIFLPAAPREAVLRDLKLWDSFCEGMGLAPSDPAASAR